MDRDPLSARYCAECGVLHPAEEGDFWAESSLLGLKITYFAMMEGKIYDITGGCRFPQPPTPGPVWGPLAVTPPCAGGSMTLTGGRVSPGRVGRLPACGDLPRHPPRPLPHLLWRQKRRPGRAAEVSDGTQHQLGPGPHPGWGGRGSSELSPAPPNSPFLPPLQKRLQGQPHLGRRPTGLLHPRLSGELRSDAWGALPAAPRPPGGSIPPRGSPQGGGHSPQGRDEAQEAEEGASAVPALSGFCWARKRALWNKKKSIFLFFFFF